MTTPTTSTNPAPRNASLDALRVLCLLGIVTLHVAGGGFHGMKPLGFVLDELSRFAVPVFFILSSYFWKPEELATPLRLTRRVAWRVMVPFVAWVAISAAWRGDKLDMSPDGLLYIVWTGGPSFHLWFLPALVVGTALVATSGRYLGWRATVALAAFLFLLGTALGPYWSLFFRGDRFPFWVDRNGLLFAPIFLVAGVLLRRHRDRLADVPTAVIVGALVVFAALQVAEGFFIVGRYPMGHDYSIATLGYAVAITALFMRLSLANPLWSTLGRATFGAYLIHLLVMRTLAGFVSFSPLLIVLVFAVSLGLALAWRSAIAAIRARGKARVPSV